MKPSEDHSVGLSSQDHRDLSSPSDEPPPAVDEESDQDSRQTAVIFDATASGNPTEDQFNDWRWQMRNRIRTLAQLSKSMPHLPISKGMADAADKFPLAITPYYASLIRTMDSSDPILQQCIPQRQELYDPECLMDDPLAEDEDMPVPGLVHRYPDRALLIATSTCAMYCRHCTRKRVAGHREECISALRLAQVTQYLTEHPEVKDVVVSGGDPFTMATSAIERILQALRAVPSVEIIRIGSRTPVTMPMRITGDLVNMLKKYQPLFVNTHFNHPVELTPEATQACARLIDNGIPVANQSVLLRGINDDPLLMEELCRNLIKRRVRPYYMFQCDLVRGVEHFRTPLTRGIEIMEYLRGRLSGLAIPTYVVDAPHGGGKIPVLPNYIVSMSPTHTVVRNFEGNLVAYPEPGNLPVKARRSRGTVRVPGVWGLATGNAPAERNRPPRRTVARKAAEPAHQLEFKISP